MIAFNKTQGKLICEKVAVSNSFRTRLVGLLGHKSIQSNEAMWISPCSMIHTYFMRFAIDAVFLDKNMKVLKVIKNLKPWRFSSWVIRAKSVLETAPGKTNGLVIEGDTIEIK
jgi:uncharacterized membrane protein (UPF0127 family)